MTKASRGFTLIEILFVASLMIIIMSVSYGIFNSAREKARDKERVAELTLIELGMRLYLEEYGTYPDCNHGIQIEPGGTIIGGGNCNEGAQLQTFLANYFSGVDTAADPLGPGNNDYFYYYIESMPCNDPSSSSNNARMIFAVNMEDTNNSNKTNVCGSAAGSNRGGYRRTSNVGGTINPSFPYVIILERL